MLANKYAVNSMIKILIKTLGLVKLSIIPNPIYPQKYTKKILLINIAIANFLKGYLLRPAAILTKKAGVKGIANSKVSEGTESV